MVRLVDELRMLLDTSTVHICRRGCRRGSLERVLLRDITAAVHFGTCLALGLLRRLRRGDFLYFCLRRLLGASAVSLITTFAVVVDNNHPRVAPRDLLRVARRRRGALLRLNKFFSRAPPTLTLRLR